MRLEDCTVCLQILRGSDLIDLDMLAYLWNSFCWQRTLKVHTVHAKIIHMQFKLTTPHKETSVVLCKFIAEDTVLQKYVRKFSN